MTNMNYQLFKMARLNTLPYDFDQWDRCNRFGWSIAHEAAKYNHLPVNFNQWNIATEYGLTVMNVMIKYGNSFEKFNEYAAKKEEELRRKERKKFWNDIFTEIGKIFKF